MTDATGVNSAKPPLITAALAASVEAWRRRANQQERCDHRRGPDTPRRGRTGCRVPPDRAGACPRPDVPDSDAALLALRSHRIERISLVRPPWFGHEQNQFGAKYFQSQGFDVVDALLADLPNRPDQIEPPMVVEWVSQHVRDRAEAVVLGGNGFRAAGAVQELEDRHCRLVLEANQVLLWSVLRSLEVSVEIHGFGGLLQHPPHGR